MNNVTLSRELVNQVLEALLNFPSDISDEMFESIRALKAALAQQAEPVQEPVAWMYTGIKQDGTEHGPHLVWKPEYMDAMSASKGAKATPLYTAPPQRQDRKPLTEDEIYHVTGHCGVSRYTAINITRAVERAHNIVE